MKILCFGAGAIGKYVGGSLGIAGNQLVFIEKAAYLPALQTNGVHIQDIHGMDHHFSEFNAFSSAEEALSQNAFDLAIIAVKSFDTATLLRSLQPVKNQLPPFLSLQNGVDNEQLLSEFLGEDRVIPASVCTAISRDDNGMIKVEKLRGIGIADGHPLSEPLLEQCRLAGLKPSLIHDARAMKWSKMISNLLSNAASAILDMTPAEVFENPVSFRLEIGQLREALAVMKALGISPINIPGVMIRPLCFAVESLPLSLSRIVLRKAVGSGRGGKMPSFYIDLHAGRKQSEVEFLNGAVVRAGKALRISTPVNQGYYQILTDLSSGILPMDTFRRNPEKLSDAIYGKPEHSACS